VTTHKVDADVSGFRLASNVPEMSGLAAAATINANLSGKTHNLIAGGDVDYSRAFMVFT